MNILNGLDFLSRNDASSNPRIRILKFLLDLLSRTDASSIPRNWIFCPEFTDKSCISGWSGGRTPDSKDGLRPSVRPSTSVHLRKTSMVCCPNPSMRRTYPSFIYESKTMIYRVKIVYFTQIIVYFQQRSCVFSQNRLLYHKINHG